PRWIAAAIVLVLAACGAETPPPAPATQSPPPADVPAPAEAKTEAPALNSDPNSELASRVKHALEAEAKIQAAAIDVTAAEGKVTLWGTAATDDERERAAKVAGSIEGVKAVENRIA